MTHLEKMISWFDGRNLKDEGRMPLVYNLKVQNSCN